MPLNSKINRKDSSNANIEHGGTETSVRVSVVRSGSEGGRDIPPPDAISGASRQKLASGLGNSNDGFHYRTNQQSRQQLSNKERDEMVSSIVQNYATINRATDDNFNGSIDTSAARIQKGEVLLRPRAAGVDSGLKSSSELPSLNRSAGQSKQRITSRNQQVEQQLQPNDYSS
jgi:hypothetical protein